MFQISKTFSIPQISYTVPVGMMTLRGPEITNHVCKIGWKNFIK